MRYSGSSINNVYNLCDTKFCTPVIINIGLPRLFKDEKENLSLCLSKHHDINSFTLRLLYLLGYNTPSTYQMDVGLEEVTERFLK